MVQHLVKYTINYFHIRLLKLICVLKKDFYKSLKLLLCEIIENLLSINEDIESLFSPHLRN